MIGGSLMHAQTVLNAALIPICSMLPHLVSPRGVLGVPLASCASPLPSEGAPDVVV